VARPTATDRLARLLALVPWVVEHPGVALDEVAARFGLKPAELASDLETLSMVGVYPYTPDALVEVTIEDGEVWVRYADWFERPLRLTPGEALALVAAGRGLLSAPGADPGGALARGLAKLEQALRLRGEAAVDVELGTDAPGVVPKLREAVEQSRQVEIDYYSLSSDETATRTVDPYAVAAEAGAWYLRAFDHRRGEERVFRVDRIRDTRVLSAAFDPPAAAATSVPVYQPRDDDPRVTIDLSPSARWVVEHHPHEAAEAQADGWTRVTLAISSPRWLAGLLVRLGPEARVVSATDGLDAAQLQAEAADRVVARYRQ
jgi:proteasome accessory factor C